MAVVEVLDAAVAVPTPSELLGVSIDAPSEYQRDDTYVLHIGGWVLGRETRARRVEVLHEGVVVHTAQVVSRNLEATSQFPDVPDDAPCGFEALVGVIGLPEKFEVQLQIELEDDRRIPVGRVTARHQPLKVPYEPRLQPLMLTSPPRSGTTWLMRTIAAHPGVIADRVHPYESWPGKYYMHALKVLTDPADLIRSSRVHGFDRERFYIGHNPFYTPRGARHETLAPWFGRKFVERLAAFLQETVDDWYLTVAESQDVANPQYFLEKQMHRPLGSPPLMWELYPNGKEIFLVRDFRDMACSKISFSHMQDELRGPLAGKSEEQYVREDLRNEVTVLHEAWMSRRDRAHLVRYEELVFEPRKTLEVLLDYLGLDRSPHILNELLEHGLGTERLREVHVTTPDVQSSVGRWRKRDEAFQALCSEVFDDLLADFGYTDAPPDGDQPAQAEPAGSA